MMPLVIGVTALTVAVAPGWSFFSTDEISLRPLPDRAQTIHSDSGCSV